MRGGVDHVWYFAYGSNMQRATLCGRRGITFRRATAARVTGWRLVFDKPPLLPIGEAFANIIPEDGGEVLGVAYELPAAALHTIDLTEGVLIGNYQRCTVPVVSLLDHDAPFEAFTLTSDRRDPGLLPSTRYMALLIEGAVEHALPAAYIDFLRAVPARPQSRAALALQPLLDGALEAMKWVRG
jgi:gamma-glutamylcyclotransferase